MNRDVDILTIAYNNLEILQIQYFFIKKYLKNSFNYYIIDNSNTSISKNIQIFCSNNGINYIKTHSPNLDGSNSNANAINIGIRSLNHSHSKYTLVLDHDIILNKPLDIYEKIKECLFYGMKHDKGTRWYLWQGLFLFKNENNIRNILDFRTCPGLDTGGCNYDAIFKSINMSDVSFIKTFCYSSLSKSIEQLKNNKGFYVYTSEDERIASHQQADMFECIDEWIHFIDTSNWSGKGSKMPQIHEFCNLILTKDSI